MRFGVCVSTEDMAAVAAAGYDYVELPVVSALCPEEPEETVLPALQEQLARLSLRADAFNVLLPGDLKVVGPDIDEAHLVRYLEAAFKRAAALGGQVVVFGSGRSRTVPEGVSVEEAEQQISTFLLLCSVAAKPYGVTLVIEPLNRGECNIINSVAEAVATAQAVASHSVRVLSDLYHVAEEHQSFSETRAAGDWLRHVHVAGAQGRRAPNSDDQDYLVPYFRILKEMGYEGRISVEGAWTDITAQAAETLDVLQQAWRRA